MPVSTPVRLFRGRSRMPALDSRGFALAELLVVVVILVALAAISVPLFSNQATKAKEATTRASVESVARFVSTSLTASPTINGADGTTTGVLSSDQGSISKDGTVVYAASADAWCVSKVSPSGIIYSASPARSTAITNEACTSASSKPANKPIVTQLTNAQGNLTSVLAITPPAGGTLTRMDITYNTEARLAIDPTGGTPGTRWGLWGYKWANLTPDPEYGNRILIDLAQYEAAGSCTAIGMPASDCPRPFGAVTAGSTFVFSVNAQLDGAKWSGQTRLTVTRPAVG